MRKESYRMARQVGGGVEFWLNLTLLEMIRWIKDAVEAQKEDEQARAGRGMD